jgi:hexosaminidase
VKTLTDAYARTNNLIFNHAVDEAVASKLSATYAVEVTVEDSSEAHPQLDTDESYTLDIPAASASTASALANPIKITAKTVYGALYALQSLSQLVVYDFDSDSYLVPSTPMQVIDAPRYPHRGMLLDTSRHYQPMSFLQLAVDSLSYAKYNVLHWHVVDTQSFPIESKSNPL